MINFNKFEIMMWHTQPFPSPWHVGELFFF